jgi:hypothetical protein
MDARVVGNVVAFRDQREVGGHFGVARRRDLHGCAPLFEYVPWSWRTGQSVQEGDARSADAKRSLLCLRMQPKRGEFIIRQDSDGAWRKCDRLCLNRCITNA